MKCSFLKADGSRCRRLVDPEGNGLCFSHAPEKAEQRRQIASQAGKGRTGRTSREVRAVDDIERQLQEIAEKVLAGELERGVARDATAALKARLAAFDTRLKLVDQQYVVGELNRLKKEKRAEQKRAQDEHTRSRH